MLGLCCWYLPPRPRDPTRWSPRAPLSWSLVRPGDLPMASSSTWNFPFRAGDWWVRAGHMQGHLQSLCVVLTTPRSPLPLVYFHCCYTLKEQVPAPDSKEIRNPATMNTVTCTCPCQPPAGGKEGDNCEMTGDHGHKPLWLQASPSMGYHLSGAETLPSDGPPMSSGDSPSQPPSSKQRSVLFIG